MKYIDAEKLKVVLASRYREITVPVITDQGGIESYFRRAEIHDILDIITTLQQEQSRKFIEINGIRYKEVPVKTDDKICKECDYFLDNGCCNLDDCPCTCADNILERIQQEQPEADLEKAARYVYESWMGGTMDDVRLDMVELGKVLNARKEEQI